MHNFKALIQNVAEKPVVVSTMPSAMINSSYFLPSKRAFSAIIKTLNTYLTEET